MLFNSFTYLVFLPIVVGLYWILPGACRRILLLIASYVFYMSWIPAYGLLILALTVANYAIALAIWAFKARGRLILTLGLIFNLACLCYYKYANFLLESLWQSCTWLKGHLPLPDLVGSDSPVVNVILPLGISFFTFEFIHYIADVYRGSAPIKSFLNFALFASFFPSQIAGPIKRYQDFMQQLLAKPVFKSATFKAGLILIFIGLFKKIVLGDNLGIVVNAAYNHPDRVGFPDAWLAAAGFQLQVFFDFSGYTDIGRGSALLLGYKVPDNFNLPFLAANLAEFWRRWHMSLSTWLRDYLFIPLGGSRVGRWRTRWNTFVTMVLGGLWHGAAWHYVIWGAFHGAGLVLVKEWQDLVSRVPLLARWRPHPLWHASGVAATWLFLFVAAILFRAENIPQALAMAHKLLIAAPAGEATQLFLTSTLPFTLSFYWCFVLLSLAAGDARDNSEVQAGPLNRIARALGNWWNGSIPAQVVSYTSAAIIILAFAPGRIEPFIYFQF